MEITINLYDCAISLKNCYEAIMPFLSILNSDLLNYFYLTVLLCSVQLDSRFISFKIMSEHLYDSYGTLPKYL